MGPPISPLHDGGAPTSWAPRCAARQIDRREPERSAHRAGAAGGAVEELERVQVPRLNEVRNNRLVKAAFSFRERTFRVVAIETDGRVQIDRRFEKHGRQRVFHAPPARVPDDVRMGRLPGPFETHIERSPAVRHGPLIHDVVLLDVFVFLQHVAAAGHAGSPNADAVRRRCA